MLTCLYSFSLDCVFSSFFSYVRILLLYLRVWCVSQNIICAFSNFQLLPVCPHIFISSLSTPISHSAEPWAALSTFRCHMFSCVVAVLTHISSLRYPYNTLIYCNIGWICISKYLSFREHQEHLSCPPPYPYTHTLCIFRVLAPFYALVTISPSRHLQCFEVSYSLTIVSRTVRLSIYTL